MKAGDSCVALVKAFESLHDDDLTLIGCQPKRCPSGVWTSGYGRALFHPVTKKFLRGKENKALAYEIGTVTAEQAESNLAQDLKTFSQAVDNVLDIFHVSLEQHQFDAVTSFTYNCGIGGLINNKSRTPKKVMQAIMTGEPAIIEKAFLLWNKCAGRVLRGLTARRRSEAHLFNTGELIRFTE